jgi:hypothetical protein
MLHLFLAYRITEIHRPNTSVDGGLNHWWLHSPNHPYAAACLVSDARKHPICMRCIMQEQIKKFIVTLMLASEEALRRQLSAALTIIAESDFPAKWDSLLPELVSQLKSNSIDVKVCDSQTIPNQQVTAQQQYPRSMLICASGRDVSVHVSGSSVTWCFPFVVFFMRALGVFCKEGSMHAEHAVLRPSKLFCLHWLLLSKPPFPCGLLQGCLHNEYELSRKWMEMMERHQDLTPHKSNGASSRSFGCSATFWFLMIRMFGTYKSKALTAVRLWSRVPDRGMGCFAYAALCHQEFLFLGFGLLRVFV